MRHVTASLISHVISLYGITGIASCFMATRRRPPNRRAPGAEHIILRTGKTVVAMPHLDGFDADGQVVKANIFVDESSDGTFYCEAFVRRLRQLRLRTSTLAMIKATNETPIRGNSQ